MAKSSLFILPSPFISWAINSLARSLSRKKMVAVDELRVKFLVYIQAISFNIDDFGLVSDVPVVSLAISVSMVLEPLKMISPLVRRYPNQNLNFPIGSLPLYMSTGCCLGNFSTLAIIFMSSRFPSQLWRVFWSSIVMKSSGALVGL